MASFWGRIGRWLDGVFGGGTREQTMDPTLIDEAIRMIQVSLEEERQDQSGRRIKVKDLSPHRQEKLANDLAQLLRQTSESAKNPDGT